ncbi:MAG: HypC/HybG/HupF family hydrogenase formation chaperone [Chthoniobacterales bacterium]
MNLNYGEVVEIFTENNLRMARVRVSAALQKVPLDLLTNVRCGDTVLVCDGVAISKVEKETNVSRDSR